MQYLIDSVEIPFIFTTFVNNECEAADEYLNGTYNIWAVPSCYLDGGAEAAIGAVSWSDLYDLACLTGAREVPDLCMNVELTHIDSSLYDINVCIKYGNERPTLLPEISGIDVGITDSEFPFTVAGSDPDGSQLWYKFSFGIGNNTEWLGPYESGEPCTYMHSWSETGEHEIAVKARDNWFHESEIAHKEVFIDTYYHGDANGDYQVNILDILYLIQFLYMDGPQPEVYTWGDVDGNIVINIYDITYLINYLYHDGPPPM